MRVQYLLNATVLPSCWKRRFPGRTALLLVQSFPLWVIPLLEEDSSEV
jgi:hypothetical protein